MVRSISLINIHSFLKHSFIPRYFGKVHPLITITGGYTLVCQSVTPFLSFLYIDLYECIH